MLLQIDTQFPTDKLKYQACTEEPIIAILAHRVVFRYPQIAGPGRIGLTLIIIDYNWFSMLINDYLKILEMYDWLSDWPVTLNIAYLKIANWEAILR